MLISELKDKLKKYYSNEKTILLQKNRLEDLKIRINEIEHDKNYYGFELDTDIKSLCYNRIKVDGGSIPESAMDREIDRIFYRLESESEKIKSEILRTKMFIRKLEFENEYIKYFIDVLEEENSKLLKLKYGDCKSSINISFIVNLSKSTVNDRINKILCDIISQIEYFDKLKV